ncbi:MAG: transcription termination factor Rho [Verrucomicrobiales bacterium]|nr:transcription termination factor Rho [Verrucomicrobiales bacterium]
MSQSQTSEEAHIPNSDELPLDLPAESAKTESAPAAEKEKKEKKKKKEKSGEKSKAKKEKADSTGAESSPGHDSPTADSDGGKMQSRKQQEPSGEENRKDPPPEKPGSESAPNEGDAKPESQEGGSGNSERRGENRPSGEGGEKRERRRRSRSRSRNRRRANDSEEGGEPREDGDDSADGEQGDGTPRKTRKQRYLERKEKERAKEAAALEAAEPVETEGIVEISTKGFGFLREKVRGFQQSPKDVFITPEMVRIYGLRDGLMVKCISKQGLRGPQLVELQKINGRDPEDYTNLPYFEELTAINPNKKLTLETNPARTTTRVIDLIAPIGRGQRGLIVAPPRTGKTTLLHHIAEGLIENYDEELHLMVLLVDERPEEVTDFQRSFPDVEVFSSSNDSDAKEHTRISLLAIERAKRLVEAGEHVFILMDSITRLARAFNSQMRGGKRGTASGGLIVGALEVPRRIFAAARNTREAGSLTIIATALIQTNSKADEAIFQEFKGTGNMELVLDRQIAQNYVYPAVDIHKSGTRREELLLPPHVLEKIYVIRRGLGGYKPLDAMEWLNRCLERYPSNAQMLMDIKTTALS